MDSLLVLLTKPDSGVLELVEGRSQYEKERRFFQIPRGVVKGELTYSEFRSGLAPNAAVFLGYD